MKFIVDHNVGKLVKRLRMLGYDTLFFTGGDDWEMIIAALREDRVILTKDTGVMKRGVVASGRVRAVLISSERADEQMAQVMDTLELESTERLFTRCMECNSLLEEREGSEVRDRVPPYVYDTYEEYKECPSCRRVYWKGTHWQAMNRQLEKLKRD